MNLQGFETDGVPAPSDFELEAADRAGVRARAKAASLAAKTYYGSPEWQKHQIETLEYWYDKWRYSGGY